MRRSFFALAAICLSALACSSGSDGGKLGKVQDIDIQLDPQSYTFPATVIGSSTPKEISIRHIGTEGVLRIEDVRFGAETDEFAVSDPKTIELNPGQETTLTVTYTPTDEIADEIELQITHNSGLKPSPAVVTLRTVSPRESLVVFPSVVAFGEVLAGTQAQMGVRVENQAAVASTCSRSPSTRGAAPTSAWRPRPSRPWSCPPPSAPPSPGPSRSRTRRSRPRGRPAPTRPSCACSTATPPTRSPS